MLAMRSACMPGPAPCRVVINGASPRPPLLVIDYDRAGASPEVATEGKVRPFTSPRRGPSTGSDHCSSLTWKRSEVQSFSRPPDIHAGSELVSELPASAAKWSGASEAVNLYEAPASRNYW